MARMRVLRGLVSIAALSLGLMLAAPAAAVPQTLTHQGRLYDSNGAPVTATLDVVFALYDSPGAPTAVWDETHTISFEDGYFSVSLGADLPLSEDVLKAPDLYLGITVGQEAEMTPRVLVASVAYALEAGNVRGVVRPVHVHLAEIADVEFLLLRAVQLPEDLDFQSAQLAVGKDEEVSAAAGRVEEFECAELLLESLQVGPPARGADFATCWAAASRRSGG